MTTDWNTSTSTWHVRPARDWMRSVAEHRYGVALFGVTLLGAALQFYQIGSRPYFGDELASIGEAQNLGTNPHALLFFVLLKAWLLTGSSEASLRTLAAFFGVAAVPLMYWFATTLFERRTALIAALLIATSAFKIDFGQEIRYYTLFLCTSLLSLAMTIRLIDRRSFRNVAFWGIAGLLCVTSHGSGIVLLGIEATAILVYLDVTHRRSRAVFLFGVSILAVTVLFIPGPREFCFNLASRYINSTGIDSGARGLSIAQIAKIPVALFSFVFGQHVYPLTWTLVIPGSLLFAALSLRGIWLFRSRPLMLLTIVGVPAIGMGVLYVLLDSLAPAVLAGASARHSIFVLPLLYLLVVAGTESRVSWLHWILIGGVVAVNLTSLGFFYYGTWSSASDLVDWRSAAAFVRDNETPDTVLVVDGRASGNATVYFPSELPTRNAWSYANGEPFGDLTSHSRVIFVTNDDRPDMCRLLNGIHRRLSERYAETGTWAQYPLFVSVYDRKTEAGPTLPVNRTTGVVSLPREIPGLEFEDLPLPARAQVGGRVVPVSSVLTLPAQDGTRELTLQLDDGGPSRDLLVLSNLTGATDVPHGFEVARIRVAGTDGSVVTRALRNGIETADWGVPCEGSAGCNLAYTWHKRIAFVGRRAFDRAWEDFPAGIFAARIEFPSLITPTTISIQSESSAWLHIWGIALDH